MKETPAAAAFVADLRARVAAGTPIVWVVTPEERAARALLAEAFGAEAVVSWTSARGLDGHEALREPTAAIARAAGSPATVRVFYDLHPYMSDPRVVRALRDHAVVGRDKASAFVIVSPLSPVPAELERDVAIAYLPLPDRAEVGALLDAELVRLPNVAREPAAREAIVRAALGLTRDQASRAFRMALAGGNAAAAVAHVLVEKRDALRSASALELIEPDVTLEDVGGLEVLKAWLRSRVLAFDEPARAFGLTEPRGMLVCGVQGCGKSLVSKAAARVLGLPLVRLDFAEVFGMAAPEHAIREAMRATEAVAPVVLWVDELEKGLAGDGRDARQVRVFGAFLTWLQERRSGVFVAATANEVDRLPPELARRGRFDEIFFVDLPSAKEREEIVRLHLGRRGRNPDAFAVEDLCKGLEHFSGAELEQVVTSSLFRAYARKADLSDADLRAAARETTPLAVLYEEKVQALREWGQTRARRASADRRTLELFGP